MGGANCCCSLIGRCYFFAAFRSWFELEFIGAGPRFEWWEAEEFFHFERVERGVAEVAVVEEDEDGVVFLGGAFDYWEPFDEFSAGVVVFIAVVTGAGFPPVEVVAAVESYVGDIVR